MTVQAKAHYSLRILKSVPAYRSVKWRKTFLFFCAWSVVLAIFTNNTCGFHCKNSLVTARCYVNLMFLYSQYYMAYSWLTGVNVNQKMYFAFLLCLSLPPGIFLKSFGFVVCEVMFKLRNWWGRARRSRNGFMESRLHHRCRCAGTPPPRGLLANPHRGRPGCGITLSHDGLYAESACTYFGACLFSSNSELPVYAQHLWDFSLMRK